MHRPDARLVLQIVLVVLTAISGGACGVGPDRFRSLRLGMSEADVQAAVGQPTEVRHPPFEKPFVPEADQQCDPRQVTHLWIYEGKDSDGLSPFVYFDQAGHIVCIRTVAYLNPVQTQKR